MLPRATCKSLIILHRPDGKDLAHRFSEAPAVMWDVTNRYTSLEDTLPGFIVNGLTFCAASGGEARSFNRECSTAWTDRPAMQLYVLSL